MEEYLVKSLVPSFMGGDSEEEVWKKIPKEALSIKDLAPKWKFTPDQVQLYLKHYPSVPSSDV